LDNKKFDECSKKLVCYRNVVVNCLYIYNKLFESLFVNFDRSNKSSQDFISLNLKPVHNSKMLRFFWKYSSNVINTYLKFKLIKWRKDWKNN
jgi:hypothetical protein